MTLRYCTSVQDVDLSSPVFGSPRAIAAVVVGFDCTVDVVIVGLLVVGVVELLLGVAVAVGVALDLVLEELHYTRVIVLELNKEGRRRMRANAVE
eukprot:6176892-Pleurochrysis_carterae.AAC.3